MATFAHMDSYSCSTRRRRRYYVIAHRALLPLLVEVQATFRFSATLADDSETHVMVADLYAGHMLCASC